MEQCKNGKAVATDVFSISSAGFFLPTTSRCVATLYVISSKIYGFVAT
jgi:hypothetical protein